MMVAGLLSLTSCVYDSDIVPDVPVSANSVTFDVEFESTAEDASGPLYDYFIDGRSVVLLSQRGLTLSIDFNDYTTDPTDPSILIPNTNLYKYVYYTNPNANWESGFNFQPFEDYALDWDQIEEGGVFNEGYALGALYYPIDYRINDAVEIDQREYDNILRSNVLGAWHVTNEIRSRLRFKFFHLMSAARVTLLIPEWNPENNTGFGENSADRAEMLSVRTEYDLRWPLNGTSEEPPTPLLKEDGQLNDIQMFLESVSNEVETINLKDIDPSKYTDETERVRRATFTVIFPPQQPVKDGPAMRFYLTTMGGTEKRYVWYSDAIAQGTLDYRRSSVTNLVLFIPRTDNDAILIKSHIEPWTEAESEFTVIPDDL